MFKVRNVFGVVGVMLFLIALYLVLVHSTGAVKLIGATTSGANGLARTLQGR
jgi:hypothetical protein